MTKDEMDELATLQEERTKLVKVKVEIENLLKLKRLYENGRELPSRVYHQRRDAMNRRLAEMAPRLVAVNARLKQLRQKRNEDVIAARGLDLQDPTTLISHAYQLLVRLKGEGVDMDPHEQDVINALSIYLAHVRTE